MKMAAYGRLFIAFKQDVRALLRFGQKKAILRSCFLTNLPLLKRCSNRPAGHAVAVLYAFRALVGLKVKSSFSPLQV